MERASRGLVVGGLLIAAVTGAACESASNESDTSSETVQEDETALPGDDARDEIVVEPNLVTDEAFLALTFPESTPRGGYFVVLDISDDGPAVAFFAQSDADEKPPTVFPASSTHGRAEYAVGGPGPDNIPLPQDLDPGTYRVCVETGRDRPSAESFDRDYEACGDFVVEGLEL